MVFTDLSRNSSRKSNATLRSAIYSAPFSDQSTTVALKPSKFIVLCVVHAVTLIVFFFFLFFFLRVMFWGFASFFVWVFKPNRIYVWLGG